MKAPQLPRIQIGAKDQFSAATALVKVRSCKAPVFSPDGSEIAFLSDLTGLPQIWAVPVEGGWPRQITALDDPITSLSWSPGGEFLAFELSPSGGMNTQVYLVRPDGTGLRQLTDNGRETNRLGPWHPDEKRLSIASNRRCLESLDTYFVDIHRGDYQQIAQNIGIGYLTDIHSDGTYAVLYRMEDRTDNNLFLLDLSSGEEQLLTPHQGPGKFTKGLFSLKPDIIYIISDFEREFTTFGRIRINQHGEPAPIEIIAERDNIGLDDFALSPDGKAAALTWNVTGYSEIWLINVTDGRQIPFAVDLPGDVFEDIVFSRGGKRLAMSVSGAALPQDIFLADLYSHQVCQVTHSPHAGVKMESLVRPSLEEFATHDNLKISGWLYLPRDYQAPGSVVLSFHGGPEIQERTKYNCIYQALLNRGIAVFAPNVRGSAGFGKTFLNADNGVHREDALRDIAVCVKYLREKQIANPEQIGIIGTSYGGYMTMAGLVHYPDLFVAGVVVSGFANFITFFEGTQPWIASISRSLYGHPHEDTHVLEMLSPIHYIDRLKAPTLILHGARDTNVPHNEADQVVKKLEEKGLPVKYILFPEEGHEFAHIATLTQATNAIVDWFCENLLKRD
jgi:dipeptidyl aminopeptidase/acylaminoacyl peptidase